MRRATLLVLGLTTACHSGQEVARVEMHELGQPAQTTLELTEGDRLELREDFATGARDDGRSVSRYNSRRCYRWTLTLTEGESTQTEECNALYAHYCDTHVTSAYESGSNCALDDCELTASTTGTATLSAQVSAIANCPIAITEHALRVRRIAAD